MGMSAASVNLRCCQQPQRLQGRNRLRQRRAATGCTPDVCPTAHLQAAQAGGKWRGAPAGRDAARHTGALHIPAASNEAAQHKWTGAMQQSYLK